MTTILITGTNRGIGLELANQALARIWSVMIWVGRVSPGLP
ncbi:hypothetical protein [uncultured Hoeflea sp.]|nr:hypothetical protein [uncultured Hoeflea sp.]